MWNRKVGIRIIEVLLCIACVVALRVTDDESRRVITYLRYRSREWSLLSNVTWGSIGAALATATCGGYVIITTGLLIAAASGELRGRKTEIFLLGLGVILFGIVGSLTLASIEHVPEDLVDNAAVLGILCLVTALAFIADLLMSTALQKTKHDGTQTLVDRDSARPMPNVTVEMEDKKSKENGTMRGLDTNGNVNEAFEQVSKHRAKDSDAQAPLAGDNDGERARVTLAAPTRHSDDRDIPFIDAERQLSASTRIHTRNSEIRDGSKAYYPGQEVILRPADEIDTPRFPRDRPETYPKIINPSVTIMRVDRDEDDNHGRYSDSSQYDNVPTRMAPGILKRGRDAYYASSRSYAAGPDRRKDEIEMLEEWVGILRKSTTGTQTSPSSPIDPGYVRHTASNWPREFKPKTPGSSPVRD